MGNWFRFFIGTPRRFLATVAAGFILASLIDTTLPSRVFYQAAQAFGPIAGAVIQLAIVCFGIRVILFGWPGSRQSSKRR